MEQILKILNDFLYSPEQQHLAYSVADAILFLFFLIAVAYLCLFAVKSMSKKRNVYTSAKKKYRFGVIFSVCGADEDITTSVDKILEQDYPRDKYDVIIAGAGLKSETITALRSTSAIVLPIDEVKTSKADCIRRAMDYIDENKLGFEAVILLDAGNEVSEDYLSKLNDAFYSGCSIVQTHGVAKTCNTNIAVLDAVSEEINNSIFRKGHTRVGLSSGLSGSGMAFEYNILKKYFDNSDVENVDKQLERYLLKKEYYIEYLEKVYTYNDKVRNGAQFYEQRSRWITSHFRNFIQGIWLCPKAAFNGNWDYCNKLVQWAMPPRILLLGFIILIALVLTLLGSAWAIKWWVLLAILIAVFAFAIPDYLFNGKLIRAIISLPIVFVQMLASSFTGIFRREQE